MSPNYAISSPKDVPEGPHYALIEGGTIYIPGDERSRTNPGHGYPEHTQSYVTYKAFPTEVALVEYIAKNLGKTSNYKVLFVKPVTVTTEVKVSVSS